MEQTGIHRSTILFAPGILILFVCITLSSCGKKAETPATSNDSTAVEYYPGDSSPVDSMSGEDDYTTYCCGNHSPAHCGVSSELEDLTKTKGCTDFSTP